MPLNPKIKQVVQKNLPYVEILKGKVIKLFTINIKDHKI